MNEIYITGTGQKILVHEKAVCQGNHCVIHNPSTHCMSEYPTHWRDDRKLMERICPHGIGHPDPDHLNHLGPEMMEWESMHGCDGCCLGN